MVVAELLEGDGGGRGGRGGRRGGRGTLTLRSISNFTPPLRYRFILLALFTVSSGIFLALRRRGVSRARHFGYLGYGRQAVDAAGVGHAQALHVRVDGLLRPHVDRDHVLALRHVALERLDVEHVGRDGRGGRLGRGRGRCGRGCGRCGRGRGWGGRGGLGGRGAARKARVAAGSGQDGADGRDAAAGRFVHRLWATQITRLLYLLGN